MSDTRGSSLSSNEARAYYCLLEVLCKREGRDFAGLSRKIMELISAGSLCESVALHILGRRNDHLYSAFHNYEVDFIEEEIKLCQSYKNLRMEEPNRHASINRDILAYLLEDLEKSHESYFSSSGGFYTNSTTDLLKKRNNRTLRLFNRFGYQSVMFNSMDAGKAAAFIFQGSSRDRNRFSRRTRAFSEKVARLSADPIVSAWRKTVFSQVPIVGENKRRRGDTGNMFREKPVVYIHEIRNPLASVIIASSRLQKALRGQKPLKSIVDNLCIAANALNDKISQLE